MKEESENMWKRELECDDKIWEVFGESKCVQYNVFG